MKATIFSKNEQNTPTLSSQLDIIPEKCKKNSNTFTLPSPHNTSVPEKTTKLQNY